MISMPLDEAYLVWLHGLVEPINRKRASQSHWALFRLLYIKEFVWLIPNDDNRAEDGKALRREFLEESGIDLADIDHNWMELPCSFLELLIGLARRLAFEAEGETRVCFWLFLEVLDLKKYTDNRAIPNEKVDDIVNKVIFRTYRRNGQGGLFPLRHPHEDQRDVELWYQLNAYLLENDNA